MNGVRCVYTNVRPLRDPELFGGGLSALPFKERREKILRMKHEDSRLLSLGAGLLLAALLREAGITDPVLSYGAQGKPFSADHPDVHFNLSHSGTLAVCAVSSAGPVGVDVERKRALVPSVAGRCFTEEELLYLDAAEDPDFAFTRLWIRKESLLKRLGDGFARDPRTVSVLPAESREALGGTSEKGTPGGAFSEVIYSGGKISKGISFGGTFPADPSDAHLICVCTETPQAVTFSGIDARALCSAEAADLTLFYLGK